MKLYHSGTIYQLLHCIALACSEAQNADLLIPEFLLRVIKDQEPIRRIFKRLLVYKPVPIKSPTRRAISEIESSFDQFFSSNGIRLDDYEEVIHAYPQSPFGIYLCKRNRPFHYVEEACGVFSRSYILENLDKVNRPNEYSLVKKFGLYDATCPLIQKIFCNVHAQDANSDMPENVQHFNVMEEILRLDEKLKKIIAAIFGIEGKINIPPDSTLLLTQHFANLNILTVAEEKRLYQLVGDYFAPENLVIKPHPSDLINHKNLFPDAQVITERFPSELIPVVCSHIPKRMIALTSTALDSLDGVVREPIRFSNQLLKSPNNLFKYHFAIAILAALPEKTQAFALGCDVILLRNMCQTFNLDPGRITEISGLEQLSEESILFLDNQSDDANIISRILEFPRNISVLFLSSDHLWNYVSLREQVGNTLVVKSILVTQDNEDIEFNVYFYSKLSEWRRLIMEKSYDLSLERSNVSVETKPLTRDEIRIKVLEGILEATQKRLLELLQRDQRSATKLPHKDI